MWGVVFFRNEKKDYNAVVRYGEIYDMSPEEIIERLEESFNLGKTVEMLNTPMRVVGLAVVDSDGITIIAHKGTVSKEWMEKQLLEEVDDE